jgi:hemoglobin
MAKDIENQADIEKLVRTFYNRLLDDPFMSPFFEGIDFEHHFPRMIHFWSFLLLNTEGFGGNVFDAHRRLDIDERHFERWISTFHKTVDDLFIGNKAEKAKNEASVIGFGFQSKLKFLKG